jgi:hypothetical protein
MMQIFPTTFVVSGTPSSGLLVVAFTTVKKDRPPDRFIVRFWKKCQKSFIAHDIHARYLTFRSRFPVLPDFSSLGKNFGANILSKNCLLCMLFINIPYISELISGPSLLPASSFPSIHRTPRSGQFSN